MFKFDMSIDENFGVFKCNKENKYVFVDSFDNIEFNVRIGTLSESTDIGKINASTSEELNRKLRKLCLSQKP